MEDTLDFLKTTVVEAHSGLSTIYPLGLSMYYEISFPGLGLSFDPDRIVCNLFGRISIGMPDHCGGLCLAVFYTCRRARQFGLKSDDILDVLLVATPTAIVCARAYYCIFNWSLFADNPISVLYIWHGGLAIYGGVIGAALRSSFAPK